MGKMMQKKSRADGHRAGVVELPIQKASTTHGLMRRFFYFETEISGS
jgi:hypothetical protein